MTMSQKALAKGLTMTAFGPLHSYPVSMTIIPAGVLVAALGDWNPLRWGSWPFFVLIALLIVVWRGMASVTSIPLQLVREILLMFAAYFAYFVVRGLVDVRVSEAFDRAEQIIAFEQRLGIFFEPRLQALILDANYLITVVNWVYIWFHWPLIAVIMGWLFIRKRETYVLYRNAFFISGAIGLIFFALTPVAPPRFLEGWSFVDTVTDHSRSYRVLQPPALTNHGDDFHRQPLHR